MPGGGVAPPIALPDINAQTYPFEVVESLLDQAAYFNMIAVPEAGAAPSYPQNAFEINGGFVLQIHNALHRFNSMVSPIQTDSDLQVIQAVGERNGTFTDRWLMSPDDFEWSLDREPPPVLFDPTRSQRFVMQNTKVTFANSDDYFHGYGLGRTYPTVVAGQTRLLVGAVGNVMEGFGRFKGLEATYTINGVVTPELGFTGNVSVRAMDPEGLLHTDDELPPLNPIPDPEPGVTYIVLRGQKTGPDQLTHYHFANGLPDGLITPGQIKSAEYAYATTERNGLESKLTIQQEVGQINSIIFVDFFAPPATPIAPGLFHTENVYTFRDCNGASIGTIQANVQLGRSFDLAFADAPGQPGLRFGGIGPIVASSGRFSGVQGLLCVNSVIGREPHALSLQNTLRIIDPEGKFRVALKGC